VAVPVRKNRLVFFGDAPEALARDVIAAGSALPDVRLELETPFPEVAAVVHALQSVPSSHRREAVRAACGELGNRLAGNLVSRYGFSLPEALLGSLRRRRLSLAIGESCTGGLVSHLVTAVPGASRVLGLGLVTYSNEVKTSLLGVRESTLERHGAVSRSVAGQMLSGLVSRADADTAIAVTGIAGPSGGSEDKPVGLVYIGACHGERRRIVKRVFRSRDRAAFKQLAAFSAMKLLLDLVRYGGGS
jgi:nicotinamide-nucleotide amidase